jgi:Flp pilus assembly protein TadG
VVAAVKARLRILRAVRNGRARWAAAGDGGFGVVEVILVAPVFVTLLLLVVVLGRVQESGMDVTGAARDGARAASLSRTADAATAAARDAVMATLARQSLDCAGGPGTTVDVSGFAPGGQVQVHVSCTVPLSDVDFTALPGHVTMSRTASSPIETFRGDN